MLSLLREIRSSKKWRLNLLLIRWDEEGYFVYMYIICYIYLGTTMARCLPATYSALFSTKAKNCCDPLRDAEAFEVYALHPKNQQYKRFHAIAKTFTLWDHWLPNSHHLSVVIHRVAIQSQLGSTSFQNNIFKLCGSTIFYCYYCYVLLRAMLSLFVRHINWSSRLYIYRLVYKVTCRIVALTQLSNGLGDGHSLEIICCLWR